eukprot:gene9504-10506_t
MKILDGLQVQRSGLIEYVRPKDDDWPGQGRVGVEVQSSGGVTASGGGRVIVAVEGHLQAAT